MIEDESGALLLKGASIDISEPFALFLMSFALHADDNATIGQRVGQSPDRGHDFRAPTGEANEARSYPDGGATRTGRILKF
jgi:hypothetical protein